VRVDWIYLDLDSQVAGSYEHSNEHCVSVNGCDMLGHLNDYYFLKKDSPP
jgi:hypothetical protein